MVAKNDKIYLIIMVIIILLALAIIGYLIYKMSKRTCIEPVDCVALNSNYKPNIPYTSWTDDSRNTAIWLINHQNKNLDVGTLQSMNNQALSEIIALYCKK